MKRLILLITILTLTMSAFAADVIIGTGTETQRFPLGSFYGFERSAALYTASEIGVQNGPITHLGWYATISTSANVPTKIYLKSTTSSILRNCLWEDMIIGATMVYDQNQTNLRANAWNMLALGGSFQVNSGQNLIIMVERNYGVNGSGTPGNGETGSGIRSSSIASMHVTWQEDYDPPALLGSTPSIRPNVLLTFSSTITSFPFFEGFEARNTDQSTAIKDWTQAAGPYYTNKYWTANSSQTTYNRAPRTGSWNATLNRSGQSTLIRPIQLTAGMHYSLEFYARQNSSGTEEISIGAKYGSQASLAGMTETIIPATSMINGDYQRFYGILSPTTSGLYYIGIQGYITSLNQLMYISLDDITINVLNAAPYALPFVEGWDSGDFATKRWTRDTSDWEIYTQAGNPAPTAKFSGIWSGPNYSSSLRSFELDATGIDEVQLSFDLSFQQITAVTTESKMTWQVWNGYAWYTIGSYNSLDGDGDILWRTEYVCDISAYASNRVFKIRFVASGENPSHLISWFIDNIKVAQRTYNPLPFIEDWSSGDFETNNWTKTSGKWKVGSGDGLPAPSAYFSYLPRIYNYNAALTSHDFDARAVNSMHFSFDLLLSRLSSAIVGVLEWEIWNGSTWITLGSYSSQSGDLDWTHYSYDVSAYTSNRIFKIRFVASGSDSDAINYWGLDNIYLGATDSGGTPITDISISRIGANISLGWTAVTGAVSYKIYSSEDPYGTYTPLTSVTTPFATIPVTSLPGNKCFFKVMAETGRMPSGPGLDHTPVSSPNVIPQPDLNKLQSSKKIGQN